MGKKDLGYKIAPEIFDQLIEIQDDLPNRATGETKKEAAPAYDHPAGLALLGEKDGKLDTIVELAMSGGCWDAPNVNYTDMDKGLRKMLALDHQVVGMALIRHPKWNTQKSSEDAKIPTHLKSQIHTLKKSFEDISKTVWIVLHNDYFRLYRPYFGSDQRVLVKETPFRKMFDKEDLTEGLIKDKIARDTEDIKHKLAERKARQEAKKAELKRVKEIKDAEARREDAAEAKRKLKLMTIDQKMKAGKDNIIDAGGGFVFMRNSKGEYVLWQTPR